MSLLQHKSLGTKVAQTSRTTRAPVLICRAQRAEDAPTGRRAALGALAGAVALISSGSPSLAAYGDTANIFGKVTNKTDFIPYVGDKFAILLPSKWNPSNEGDTQGDLQIELRYEDNYYPVNYLTVSSKPSDKGSIEGYGDPSKFLQTVSYLMGQQAYSGDTMSEGGFAPNRVSAASLLGQEVTTDKRGNKYYKYQLLTRSADGNEGGRHQLISATVGNGRLYVVRCQMGDKRWFRDNGKGAQSTVDSFTVAV